MILTLRNTILNVLIISMVFSCKYGTTEKTTRGLTDTTQPATKHTTDTSVADVEYPTFAPKLLSLSTIGKTSQICAENLTKAVALKMLFPGNLYCFEQSKNQTMNCMVWKCTDCSQKSFPGWFGEESQPFPFSDGNITLCEDSINYVDDLGSQHMLMSLSTTYLQSPDVMFCGRFTGVVLSLALFTKKNEQWVLDNFELQAGYYGAFQQLPKIYLVRLGQNNFGCYLFDSNGGGGGVYYSNIHVYGLVNNRFRKLLTALSVQRFNTTLSEWSAKLYGDTIGRICQFGDIRVLLEGDFDREIFEQYDDELSNAPSEIRKEITKRDSFGFRITRTFKYQKGAYKQTSSTATFK